MLKGVSWSDFRSCIVEWLNCGQVAVKQFVLGVGCQKGGTTWLHDQLRKSIYFEGGIEKEYHIFDAINIDVCHHFHKTRERLLLDAISAGEKPSSRLFYLNHFYHHPSAYFLYFDSLWSRSESVTTVGDITPTYSGLGVNALRDIKAGLEEKGFDVKVIFLMRDPFERIWSSVRMNKRYLADRKQSRIRRFLGGTANQGRRYSDQEILLSAYKSKEVEMRTRYDLTIQNLEKVFEPNQIFYSLYEDLFRQETIERLSWFLNLDPGVFDVGYTSNVSPKTDEVDDEIRLKICSYYHGVYEFISKRFDVSGKWHNVK